MFHSITYVVIANWNGKETLHRCLTSLFANTPMSDYKVVVVDNGSTDGSIEMLKNKFLDVELIQNAQNFGFSRANNQGIRHALARGAKYVLLLNNDIEISDERWLQSLIDTLEFDSKNGIVGCKLLYPNGKIQHAGGVIKLRGSYNRGECEVDTGRYDKIELLNFVTGAVLLIKSDVIRKIGRLDEKFTPLYYEDTDWCVRARLHGYNVVYTPNPTLIHHCGSSANTLGLESKMFYLRRSSIRFFLLNLQFADICKRIITFELRILFGCLFMRSRSKDMPVTLRPDASIRILLFIKAWLPSIRDLKGIIALRRQRFKFGARLVLEQKKT